MAGARFRGHLAAWVVAASFAHATTLLAQNGCLRLDQGTTGHYRLEGRFLPGTPTAGYCIVARAGQHLRIDIKPSADLDTEGHLQFAGTAPHRDWMRGAPGGIVFDEAVPWVGEYRLVIAQRFNEKRTGRFAIEITIFE